MKTRSSVKGYLRGLEEIGAKPANTSYTTIYNRVHTMAQNHGEQVSAGANADKLQAIAQEKIAIHKDQVRRLNSEAARLAAGRLGDLSKSIRDRYETNPTKKLADIMDAQARIGSLNKAQATAMAEDILSGDREPNSEYELLELTKNLPKHEITKEYRNKDDFALWTAEGKAAFAEMQTYATMGDRIPFTTADGDVIGVDPEDLYAPPTYSPREVAERQMEGQI